MRARRNTFTKSFVVTVAAVSAAATLHGCGGRTAEGSSPGALTGEENGENEVSGGGAGGGQPLIGSAGYTTNPPPPTAGAGGTSFGPTGGAGGTTVSPPFNPPPPVITEACPTPGFDTYYDSFEGCTPQKLACHTPVRCTSGQVHSVLQCDGDAFETTSCDNPAERCETQYENYHCDGGRWLIHCGSPGACNPPAPCPFEPPEVGSECFPDGFGGDRGACGYPCDSDPSTWTVLRCVAIGDAGESYEWVSDGACQ